MELPCKPDFDMAMRRIYAWYQQEMIDRPPIRFTAHNAEYDRSALLAGRSWPDLKARWFDAEFQVDFFIESIKGRTFHAETFPVFWPNLGPEIYVAFHGSELIFKEVTSYSVPLVKEWDDMAKIRFDMENAYFRKIEEMTRLALEKCDGRFLVGYTDLHGGVDCAAAWRDPQQLCMDLVCCARERQEADRAGHGELPAGFRPFRRHAQGPPAALRHLDGHPFLRQDAHPQLRLRGHDLDAALRGVLPAGAGRRGQADDAQRVSPGRQGGRQAPGLDSRRARDQRHPMGPGDGRRYADHAMAAADQAIQAAGKSVLVDLQLAELEEFIENMDPKGLMLCIAADETIQPDVIRRVEKW